MIWLALQNSFTRLKITTTTQIRSSFSLPQITKIAVVTLCTLAFGLNAAAVLVTLTTDRYVGSRDFITYWAAGQRLVQHANPYDARALLPIERRVGFPSTFPPMVMRNAPPALITVLPLGVLSVRFASVVWGLLLSAALWFSIRLIVQLFAGQGNELTLLAYAFAPAISCLISGQMSIFALLGLVLFLKLYSGRPFLAGAALWLCALKPQVFVLFGLVLIASVVRNRQYRIFGGFLTSIGLSSACAMALVPDVWADYFRMIRDENIPNRLIPCVSTLLRIAISPTRHWIQLVPSALGCSWAIWYFVRHRREWNWLEHGAPLMLVSVLVAPYSWFMDQVVLLPAIMKRIYAGTAPTKIAILAILSAVVEFTNLAGVPLGNMRLYSWSAAWWPLWYMWTVAGEKVPAAQPEPQAAPL